MDVDCRECGKCCEVFRWYTRDPDIALRFDWLDTDRITVEQVTAREHLVTIDIRCEKLVERDGRYRCEAYHDDRPGFCETYPDDFLRGHMSREAVEREASFCPKLDQKRDKMTT